MTAPGQNTQDNPKQLADSKADGGATRSLLSQLASQPLSAFRRWRGVAYTPSQSNQDGAAVADVAKQWRGVNYNISMPSTAEDYSVSFGDDATYNTPPKGLGIGLKATLLAALFGVLPVLVVGNVAYRSANQSITERIAQEEITGVDQLSDQLRRFLQERVANVSTIANITQESTLFVSELESGEKALGVATLGRELTQFVQDYRTYSSLGIFDLNGEVLVQSLGSA
ncbi:MAG: hypothetical protein WBG38_04460, partial [Nodosilinea sp.]